MRENSYIKYYSAHFDHYQFKFRKRNTKMEAITVHHTSITLAESNDVIEFHYIIHPITSKMWIAGTMVCHSLKYVNSHKALQRHVSKEHKSTLEDLIKEHTIGKLPKKLQKSSIMIDETGFKMLIFGSRLPIAKQYAKSLFGIMFGSVSSLIDANSPSTSSLTTNNNEETLLQKIQRLERENSKYKTEVVKYENKVTKTHRKLIVEKTIKKHNINVCKKVMEKLEISKKRTIPDIESILPNKVHMIALYILNRNVDPSKFNEQNRPFHYVSRSQKERIDEFDKIIADSIRFHTESVHERDERGNLSIRQPKNIPKSCLWLKNATCYFKKQVPNAITQWIDVKYWNNPLWFGITMTWNKLQFLNKQQLIAKMHSNQNDYPQFINSLNIRSDDDLISHCYTSFEDEQEVLQMLVEEDVERTLKEFEIVDQLKYSENDLTMDEIAQEVENYESDDDMDNADGTTITDLG